MFRNSTDRSAGIRPRLALSPDFVLNTPATLHSPAAEVLNELVAPKGTITEITLSLVSADELARRAGKPAPTDAYYMQITETSVAVWSETIAGLFYAVNALLRRKLKNNLCPELVFRTPSLPFRGLKVYIPARKDIPYFQKIVNLCAYFGFNKLVIEVGGAMEYKRHPEINEGWEEYTALFNDYQGQSLDYQQSFPFHKNSIHCENGGGSFLTQAEVQGLVDYAKARGLEVIPEVPCLSHCDYLLTRHREIAERQDDFLADTYCPSDPRSYELLFDVLEEIIQVFAPSIVHIGHDEFYTIGLCDKCKTRDAAEIYATDIQKIYDWLKARNIQTMMWGEKLLHVHGADGTALGGSERDRQYSRFYIPPTYPAIDLIPKDIHIMHWYWSVQPDCEMQLFDRGFPVTFGNFTFFAMRNWPVQVARGVQGLCISNWSGLNAPHMQRNHILIDLAVSSLLLWDHSFESRDREENIKLAADTLFAYMNRETLQLPHLAIRHASAIRIPHKAFVDGYTIDFEGDLLGHYKLTYADKTTETIPVHYGLNIGPADAKSYGNGGLLEATGTCRPSLGNDKAGYTFVHPLSGPAPLTVTFQSAPGKEGAVETECIRTHL